MQKEISKLKKDLRKTAKEEGYNLYASRDNNCFGLTKQYAHAMRSTFSYYIRYNCLFIHGYDHDHTKVELLYNHFWKEYAKLKKCDAIFIVGPDSQSVNKLAEAIDFEHYKSENAKKWSSSIKELSNYTICNILNNERYDLLINSHVKLAKLLDNLKQEDPTSISDRFTEYNLSCFKFYIEGVSKVAYFVNTEEKLEIFIRDEERNQQMEIESFVIKSEKEIKDILNNSIEKIKNRVKIKNLFDYPTFHFDKYFHQEIRYNNEIKKVILSILRTHNNPKDIELHFSKQHGQKLSYIRFPRGSWQNDTFHKFTLMNVIFIKDNIGNIYNFKIDEDDKAELKYKELILQTVEKQIDLELNNAKQTVNK